MLLLCHYFITNKRQCVLPVYYLWCCITIRHAWLILMDHSISGRHNSYCYICPNYGAPLISSGIHAPCIRIMFDEVHHKVLYLLGLGMSVHTVLILARQAVVTYRSAMSYSELTQLLTTLSNHQHNINQSFNFHLHQKQQDMVIRRF